MDFNIDLGELGKKIMLWSLIALLTYGAFRLCSGVFGTSASNQKEMTTNGRYTVTTDCYGAYTKEALKELSRHLTDNNMFGAYTQLSRGELVSLKEGTKVILVDYGMSMCKVEVVSGENAGETLYVITEFIEP